MKWKTLAFWLFVFTGIYFFFCSFNPYFYGRQEEVQLFFPECKIIWEMLREPSGFCTVLGQAIVQYYPDLSVALIINSFLLCTIGFLCYSLLQEIAPRVYNLFLALVPVFGLMKVHIRSEYVLDGTIGLCLMMLLLYVFVRVRKVRTRFWYGIGSTVALYLLAGQLAALYGILLVVLSYLCGREKWYHLFVALLAGVALTYAGIRLAICIPLTDGIYSEHYQEVQMQPDSYIYFVWIRFTLLLFILLLIGTGMKYLPWNKIFQKVIVTGCTVVVLFFFSSFCLPNQYDVQNMLMDKLSDLQQKGNWDAIIQMHQGKKIRNYISLNYLNMALAQKGRLGNELFHYDQRGPLSLLASWNRTYYMSCLLSDIHYMIGDISLSEGYAMEGLTLAKRGGSPRMLQRLVKISLIRNDFDLANKYLDILARLPHYRRWAEIYEDYVYHPERIKQDKELSAKTLSSSRPDNLLCLIELDSLWMGHIEESGTNRIAWEYLGCSYLLAKEMEKFKTFLLRTGQLPEGQSLPVHFQEAALVLAVEDVSILDTVPVRTEILQRYKQFQKDILKIKNSSDGFAWLYQQYGDTFWFYYYCKKLNG